MVTNAIELIFYVKGVVVACKVGKMMWICGNGHQFVWVRTGLATKPSKCPICGNSEIDYCEV